MATAFVYAPVLRFPFINYDDPTYVTGNARVLGGLSWDNVRWAFLATDHPPYWHPITLLSHMLDVQLFGLNAGGHHAVSVLFHLGNTALLFGLLLHLTGAPGRSAAVAALFALHPLRVESVAWVAERKDVLSTLFWLLATWAYVVYARRPRPLPYAAVLVFFTLGLLSKPMLVTLPFALLLLDYWPLGRMSAAGGTRSRMPADRGAQVRAPAAGAAHPRATRGTSVAWTLAMEKLPLLVLAALVSLITYEGQRGAGALEARAAWLRVGNALNSYVLYLRDLFWPLDLAAIYPYPESMGAGRVAAAALLLLAVTALVVRFGRARPYLPVGWFWYLGTLLPVIGLIQVGPQARADRFTYVPHIGLLLALVWGTADLLGARLGRRARGVLLPATAAAALALSLLARRQVDTWESSVSVWERALEVTSENGIAHYNLGIQLMGMDRRDEAVVHLRQAVRLLPQYTFARNRLGILLAERGDLEEAHEHFAEVVRLMPFDSQAHYNLGLVLADRGRFEEAVRHFAEAVRLNPQNAAARRSLEELTGGGGGG